MDLWKKRKLEMVKNKNKKNKRERYDEMTTGHFPVRNNFFFFLGHFHCKKLLLMKVRSRELVVFRFSGIFEAQFRAGCVLIDIFAAFHTCTSPRVFKPVCGCIFC